MGQQAEQGVTTEDRLAIIELVARYNYAIDHLDPEGWAATFTEDGALVSDGAVRGKGREALAGYIARMVANGGPRLRHWAGNFVIEGTGSRARLRCYVLSFNITTGLAPAHLLGEYDDELVKIGDDWKFRLRRLTPVAGKPSPKR